MDFDTLLSSDRVVYSFVMAWALAGIVWLALDWLGNPNRGTFRPKGDAYYGTRKQRRDHRRVQRAEEDAAVRSTLRDAYGTSSLRVMWNKQREAGVIDADENLVRGDPLPRRRRLRRQSTLVELDEHSLPIEIDKFIGTYDEADPPTLPMPRARGRWKTGSDPLMLNRNGKAPTAATIRSRAWKNLAGESSWGVANQDRMRAGKPPRRYNPLSGKAETASIDASTAKAGWRMIATDPFSSDDEPT